MAIFSASAAPASSAAKIPISPSISLDMQAADADLALVSEKLASVKNLLHSVAQNSRKTIATLESRILELEVAIQELQEQNAELRAINGEAATKAAREQVVAARKLRHARKVIRDLLDERTIGPLPADDTLASAQYQLLYNRMTDNGSKSEDTESTLGLRTLPRVSECVQEEATAQGIQSNEERDGEHEDADEAALDAMGERNHLAQDYEIDWNMEYEIIEELALRESSITEDQPRKFVEGKEAHRETAGGDEEGDSEDVIRPRTSANTPRKQYQQDRVAFEHHIRMVDVATCEVERACISRPSHRPFAKPARAVLHSSGGSSRMSGTSRSSGDTDKWTILFVRPPSSAVFRIGPFTWEKLGEKLHLVDDRKAALERLAVSKNHGLRLEVVRSIAFVYDPIFLETPNKVYLVDWGAEDENRRLANVLGPVESERPLHTFLFIVERNGWYYVGAHTWKPVPQLKNIWPTLDEEPRKQLLEKLQARSHGTWDTASISQMLDARELVQFGISISSTSHREMSYEFAARIGYKQLLKRNP